MGAPHTHTSQYRIQPTEIAKNNPPEILTMTNSPRSTIVNEARDGATPIPSRQSSTTLTPGLEGLNIESSPFFSSTPESSPSPASAARTPEEKTATIRKRFAVRKAVLVDILPTRDATIPANAGTTDDYKSCMLLSPSMFKGFEHLYEGAWSSTADNSIVKVALMVEKLRDGNATCEDVMKNSRQLVDANKELVQKWELLGFEMMDCHLGGEFDDQVKQVKELLSEWDDEWPHGIWDDVLCRIGKLNAEMIPGWRELKQKLQEAFESKQMKEARRLEQLAKEAEKRSKDPNIESPKLEQLETISKNLNKKAEELILSSPESKMAKMAKRGSESIKEALNATIPKEDKVIEESDGGNESMEFISPSKIFAKAEKKEENAFGSPLQKPAIVPSSNGHIASPPPAVVSSSNGHIASSPPVNSPFPNSKLSSIVPPFKGTFNFSIPFEKSLSVPPPTTQTFKVAESTPPITPDPKYDLASIRIENRPKASIKSPSSSTLATLSQSTQSMQTSLEAVHKAVHGDDPRPDLIPQIFKNAGLMGMVFYACNRAKDILSRTDIVVAKVPEIITMIETLARKTYAQTDKINALDTKVDQLIPMVQDLASKSCNPDTPKTSSPADIFKTTTPDTDMIKNIQEKTQFAYVAALGAEAKASETNKVLSDIKELLVNQGQQLNEMKKNEISMKKLIEEHRKLRDRAEKDNEISMKKLIEENRKLREQLEKNNVQCSGTELVALSKEVGRLRGKLEMYVEHQVNVDATVQDCGVGCIEPEEEVAKEDKGLMEIMWPQGWEGMDAKAIKQRGVLANEPGYRTPVMGPVKVNEVGRGKGSGGWCSVM